MSAQEYRCGKCGTVKTSYAAAERHADGHRGGARIEFVLPPEQNAGTGPDGRTPSQRHLGRMEPGPEGGDRTRSSGKVEGAVPAELPSDDNRSMYRQPPTRARRKRGPHRRPNLPPAAKPSRSLPTRPTKREREVARAKIEEARRLAEQGAAKLGRAS